MFPSDTRTLELLNGAYPLAMAAFYGLPTSFRRCDPGDDDRSVLSAGSSGYFDLLHPPLTARLPPAVRKPMCGKSKAGAQRLSQVSDKRLSQLEAQLRELEMEDWRADRLIFAASRETGSPVKLDGARFAGSGHGDAGKPDLPPRRAAPDGGRWNGGTAGVMTHGERHERSHASEPAIEPARQPAAGGHRESAAAWHDEPPSRRTRHDAGHSATHMPSHVVQHQRLAERSHKTSGANYSFGSPFAASELSMLQSPGYVPARPAHHIFNDTPGVHTKFDELSAIRSYTQELSLSTSATASRCGRPGLAGHFAPL